MIADIFSFLRARLNKAFPGDLAGAPGEDLFVYAGRGTDGSVSFKLNAVSILLIRIEEDPTLRQPDLYSKIAADGTRQRIHPEIRMNLYVLLVAPFSDDYPGALENLSRVIAYFQNHRVFNQDNSPDLKEEIYQLIVELVTPTFSEQSEIWGSLRTAYQPSALYKIKMIVFQDQQGQPLSIVKEVIQTVVEAQPA